MQIERKRYPETPDGRYFVIKGRLWRRSNPTLDHDTRETLVKALMNARRAVRDNKLDTNKTSQARKKIHEANRSGRTWTTMVDRRIARL